MASAALGLWGPASVKSLNGNSYVARGWTIITRRRPLFQPNKSDTYKSYVRDEALIETHSGNRIKFLTERQRRRVLI